uniref:SDR family NAD(P)-dependent oxidoreductase n=1 Tax=Rhizobium sp. F40D2 TaxID=3453141 RepID=UPI003F26AB6E
MTRRSKPASLRSPNVGRIDVLHNHAGAQVAGDLEQVAVEGFDRSWRLNVRAHFMAARFVMPLMKAGRGVILNTSSSSSSGGRTLRSLRLITLRRRNMQSSKRPGRWLATTPGSESVNALCPGWVDTPFNEPFIAQMGGPLMAVRPVAEEVPLGRWADV